MAKKNYRRAKSLIKLMSQFNLAAPGRDTASDGWIGDAAHASNTSDHNPWVIDRDGVGVVTAQDIDEDLNLAGVTLKQVIDSIIADRDDRVKYIIYEGKMCSSYPARGFKAWSWRPYTGKNAHKIHAHISVQPQQKLYDDESPWAIGIGAWVPATKHISAAVSAGNDVHVPTEHAPAETPASETPSSNEQPPTLDTAVAGGDQFKAYVPQIDSAKSWIGRAFAGTSIGAAIAFFAGLPMWLQIFFCSLLVLIVVGAIVIFVKYHDRVFAYVTGMNTLRATSGVGNPIVAGPPPQ